MHGRGCVHGGEHAWQGACVVGGVAGGHAWQGECAWQGACVAGETATAAGGKHPTRMHSCYVIFFNVKYCEKLPWSLLAELARQCNVTYQWHVSSHMSRSSGLIDEKPSHRRPLVCPSALPSPCSGRQPDMYRIVKGGLISFNFLWRIEPYLAGIPIRSRESMTSYANDIITQDKSYKYRVWGRSSLVHSWHLVQKVRISCRITPLVGNRLLKGIKG